MKIGDDMGLGWLFLIIILSVHFALTNIKLRQVDAKIDILIERTKGDAA
jgi:hypothetical protein